MHIKYLQLLYFIQCMQVVNFSSAHRDNSMKHLAKRMMLLYEFDMTQCSPQSKKVQSYKEMSNSMGNYESP